MEDTEERTFLGDNSGSLLGGLILGGFIIVFVYAANKFARSRDIDVPTKRPMPNEREIDDVPKDNKRIVYFDLETNGLCLKSSEICQIAAKSEEEEFNVYVMPKRGDIPAEVSAITHLTVANKRMFYKGKAVPTVPLDEALAKFLQFVGENAVLIAHNGFRFDVPILYRCVIENGLWPIFASSAYRFSDTLIILRNTMPERRSKRLSFSQMALAKDLLGIDVSLGSHNALNDVRTLAKIAKKVGISDEDFINASKSIDTLLH